MLANKESNAKDYPSIVHQKSHPIKDDFLFFPKNTSREEEGSDLPFFVVPNKWQQPHNTRPLNSGGQTALHFV